MAIHQQTLAFAFGLLGNVISFMVFLAPLPTLVKNNTTLLLITINSFGVVVETIYLAIFLFYASKMLRLKTIRLVLLLDVFGFGAMLLSSLYLSQGKRLKIIGWISLVFNITREVIETKSVEYMPFTLCMCLTANAVIWFSYGFFLKDYFIALPNTIGFLFGMFQMVLYLMYRNAKAVALEDPVKVQELSSDHMVDVVNLGTMVPEDADNVTEQKNTNPGEQV